MKEPALLDAAKNLSAEELKEKLRQVLNMNENENTKSKRIWKGRGKARNEKEDIT